MYSINESLKLYAPFVGVFISGCDIPSEEIKDLPNEILNYEPLLALDGGKEGLDYIIQLIETARSKLLAGGLLALEIDSRFGKKAKELAKGYTDIEIIKDLTGRDRYLFARR